MRNQTQVTADLIAAGERLEIVARAGVGLDNIDVRAASRAGVVVALAPSQNAISVAELSIGLMLALARKIPAADRHVKQGGWARHQFTGSELFGKTLGVVGFGRIGYLTARRAAAFGMDILAHDPYLDPDALTVAEVRPRILSLEELLAAADVVTCHLPGNEETRAIFNYQRFCCMKRTALFLNVARGEVVDEEGLVRALSERRIAGAALDVREKEPPQVGPLDQMDNVILTPHIVRLYPRGPTPRGVGRVPRRGGGAGRRPGDLLRELPASPAQRRQELKWMLAMTYAMPWTVKVT